MFCQTKTLPIICLTVLLSGRLSAQTVIQHRNPEIAGMVQEVSADTLQSYVEKLVSFGTRHTLSNQTDSKRGIGAAKRWILAKFNAFAQQSGQRLTAVIDDSLYSPDKSRVDKAIMLGDVVATLKGTDPNDHRVFIITGHLDSRVNDVMDSVSVAPGANDDASGVAALMECARIMSTHQFPATIVFAALSGEEQGLLGAKYLAHKYKNKQVAIAAALNNDMVGNSQNNGTLLSNNTQVRVFSTGIPFNATEQEINSIRNYGMENDGSARQLARYIKETGERYVDNLEVVMVYRNDRFGRGGDHTPFAQEGYAAVRITDMHENFNHQHQSLRTENGLEYGDLVKFMDFEYLRKNTALNLVSLASLAKAPSTPQQVFFSAARGQVPNSTSISWEKPKSGKVKGYYVLIRKTTDYTWQQKFYTDQTTMDLPYSKDNYLFAVQAVNADGNESLAVFAGVGRRRE